MSGRVPAAGFRRSGRVLVGREYSHVRLLRNPEYPRGRVSPWRRGERAGQAALLTRPYGLMEAYVSSRPTEETLRVKGVLH